ncbi:unnamed protein product [Ambrosiozyma monospora]|uniref:Unnamed protein product n=1 Tax=Ambrosiozyma monospora TaxID=43982 RepID=A0ACB5SR73_AMBMO|nr:unnamed protein product [Ambrosiozyma monospora]
MTASLTEPELHTQLIPFDHTYILFDPNDPFSLPIAIFSILPILILVFLFSWFVTTREIEPCFMALGQTINDIISIIFKKIVKFERPKVGQIFKTDGGLVYGMPSSHSQFVAFFTTYLVLKMCLQWPHRLSPSALAGSIALVLVSFALVVYSRLYFQYHTVAQCVVGCLLGLFLGSGYFLTVSLARDIGIVDWVLSWNIAGCFSMKDSFNSQHYPTLEKERQDWLDQK